MTKIVIDTCDGKVTLSPEAAKQVLGELQKLMGDNKELPWPYTAPAYPPYNPYDYWRYPIITCDGTTKAL